MSISIDREKKGESYLDFPTKSEPNPFSKYNTIVEQENPKKNKTLGKKKGNFLKRNYKIKKPNEELKMMSEAELNNLYYKLKFYYDDILGQNQKQDSDIEYIRGKNYTVEKKIFDYERAKAVESGTEKISGFDEANNIDSIINKINELKEKTEDTKFNVKNEEEYTSTLKYLMEDSKSILLRINEDILNTEQKIHDIKIVRKNLDENINNRKNANIESNRINNYLEQQIEKIKEVLEVQKDKKMNIEEKNKIKEEELLELKEQFEDNKKKNKIKFKQHKDEVLEKIASYHYRKNQKQEKEKKIVNFIIGFYFFQKYFINKNRENKDKEEDESIDMTECKKDIEFNDFMKGKQYCLESESENEENESENISSDKKRKKYIFINKKKIHKISFQEVKERFDELDLQYDEIRKEQIIRFQRFIENNENNLKNAEKIRNIKASQRITDIHLENIINPDLNIIKKQNAFINKCNDACAKIKFYFESINIGIKHLNNLRDYDTAHQIQNTYKKIMNYTVNFTEKNKNIKKEEYIENLLKYSKEKKIPYAEFIYNILFNSKKQKENMKQFLNDNLTEDNFMFYFFRNYKDRHSTDVLLNDIIKYYKGKLNGANLGKIEIREEVNKVQLKKKGSNISNQSNYLKKKSINNSNVKMKTIEEINKEYNYEKAIDDIDGYNYHKITRSNTTKITTNKRIVQHLYEPSLEKSQYLRNLNNGLSYIKTSNSNRKLNNRYIIKTWNNIDNLENQFYIYNNRSKILLFLFF